MGLVVENGLYRVIKNRVGTAIQEFGLLSAGDHLMDQRLWEFDDCA